MTEILQASCNKHAIQQPYPFKQSVSQAAMQSVSQSVSQSNRQLAELLPLRLIALNKPEEANDRQTATATKGGASERDKSFWPPVLSPLSSLPSWQPQNTFTHELQAAVVVPSIHRQLLLL